MKTNYINRVPVRKECGRCEFYLITRKYVFGRSICSHGLIKLPITGEDWEKIGDEREVSVDGVCDDFVLESRYTNG